MNLNFLNDDLGATGPQVPEIADDQAMLDVGDESRPVQMASRADTQYPPLQLYGHLLHLVAQVDHMQSQLGRLVEEMQFSSSQVAALTRHLTDLEARRPIDERLADLLTRLETTQEQLNELTQTVTKLGRTQFKSNALAETKEQQIAAALATLQEILTRREAIQEARELEEQRETARQRAEARGELMADLLPVLDGLELALDNGYSWLEQRRQQVAQAAYARTLHRPQAQGMWHKLRQALVGEPRSIELPIVSEATDETSDSLMAWLQGLELVRERFLSLLAAEGIQPIPALQQPFDPRVHVAMETEFRSDVPSGIIVKVLRKGYRQQDRVLRYAEVVVARAPEVRASESVAQPDEAVEN